MIERACLWRKTFQNLLLVLFVRYPCTWRRASPRRRVCDIVLRRKVFSRRRALMFLSQLQVVTGQVATSLSIKVCDARAHRRLCQCQSRSHCLRIRLFWYVLQHRRCQRFEVCLQGVDVCANRKSRWECSCKVNRGWLCCDWVCTKLVGKKGHPFGNRLLQLQWRESIL